MPNFVGYFEVLDRRPLLLDPVKDVRLMCQEKEEAAALAETERHARGYGRVQSVSVHVADDLEEALFTLWPTIPQGANHV